MNATVVVWHKTLSVIRFVTSLHGDNTAACLEELSLTFKLLVIEQTPQSYG